MSRLLSPNSEILILAFIGFVITVVEAMHLNLNEHLQDAWKVSFPADMLSATFENLLKSVISGIIIVRGSTVHVHLASYLLLIFPVLKERRRILILIWLTVSGFRSIFVNGVATLVGICICSCLPDAHPACFEFLSTKGFELACSVFMWVLVNDFLHYLKKSYRTSDTITEKPSIIKRTGVRESNNKSERHRSTATSSGRRRSTYTYDPEESVSSTLTDTSMSNETLSEGSFDSIIAKAAVNWLFRMTLGMKNHGQRADKEEELTQKFFQMSPEEVEKMMEKLQQILSRKSSQREDTVYISDDAEEDKSEPENKKKKSSTFHHPADKAKDEKSKVSLIANKSSIFCDPTIVITTGGERVSPGASFSRNVGSQTDRLPKTILKRIELQEKEIQEKRRSTQKSEGRKHEKS